MGMVHQIRVIARVPPGPEGTYRAIDALSIPSDEPGPEKLTSTVPFPVRFLHVPRQRQPANASTETLSDVEWSREEEEGNSVPQFPVVRICLLLAALAHDKHWFMFRLRFELLEARFANLVAISRAVSES
ncbi:hypothetical protein NUW58_g10537 [Xylaria curta]|uniref:Uncharacterized protein n=1 Tax=Xylaria curta TaxID=42375 RepID=A0ACC1MJ95_9PEZI|nr:hypothetical protein NUW58_g10537 [Xylaria curta]